MQYYEPELDLNGTSEELYIQAGNGYIEDPDALRRIAEILEQEGRSEQAERVRYMEEREREENTHLYSVAQMKLDFMDKTGGIDSVEIGDGLNLSVSYEPQGDNVVVSLSRTWRDGDEDVLSTGTAGMSLEEFKNMNRADFERFVGEVNAYNMEEQGRVSFLEREAVAYRENSEYGEQIDAIYMYEIENRIPENDRMTRWYAEQEIPVAKPWYKENDPSVMDRAEGERHIPINAESIAARYAEIEGEKNTPERREEEYQRQGNPDYYKLFYDYEHDAAAEYAASMGYHMVWGGDQQGLNGGCYMVYRDAADLPQYLREYAAEQERRGHDLNLMAAEHQDSGNHVAVRAAAQGNYTGYNVFSLSEASGKETIYLGKPENYMSAQGTYDNSDQSLVRISDNPKMFAFLEQGAGWTESQQSMIDNGAFTEADYEEYARLKETVLKQFEQVREKNFSISEKGSGTPFRFPDWKEPAQEEKAPANEGIEQPEEKKTAKDVLSDQLKAGIRDVMNSDSYKSWLDTSSRLYYNNYSFNNAMLVFMQKPDATYTMGYDAWKDYGRSVAQGAKGAKVFVPVMAYEKTQGSLYRMIMQNLKEQLKETPGEVAVYKLGSSRLDFTMNNNGQIGYRIDGKEKGIFQNQQQLQRFIQGSILGKVPMYFTTGTVFDTKDTITPEYLWVKKGYTRDEVVKGEDGKPIKNKRGEVKIHNTPERQAKFNTSWDMGVPEKPKEQMEPLYDSLRAVCERNGVHVYEQERELDETLKGGADGYFSRRFDGQNPKGYIVMPTDLEPTRKVAVLMHEAAHSDLHGNLELLAQRMGEKNVPAHMREIQAESVAYAVAKRFGIETDTSSFRYLAAYSKGFKLQDLHKSMDVIYQECKKMTQEIAAELDARGLTIDLEEKISEPMQKDTIETLSRQYTEYALAESDNISTIRPELPKLAIDNRDNPNLLCVIKEQKYCIDRQESAIGEIQEGVEKLQASDTREQQDTIINQIEAAKRRLETEKGRFAELEQSFMEISSQEKRTLREEFFQNPEKTIETMKAEYPRLGELSKSQLDYIAKSEYIQREYTPLLKNSPEKFADEVCRRAESLDSIISKKGCFVEVNNCEQWTDKPIVSKGALMHPKVANDIVKQGEMQVRALKSDAEKNGTYFPYNKCRLTVFTQNGDNSFKAYQTRVDLGDGSQVSLADHLCRECKDNTIVEDFEKATREKGAKEKILFNDTAEQPEVKEEREETEETLDTWENDIQKEKGIEQDHDHEKAPVKEYREKENR